MKDCDFLYRGESLEDHGYMLCNFNSSDSAGGETTDSQRTYSSFSAFNGKYFPIIFYKYENALEMEMSVCKLDSSPSPVITPAESSEFKRWLSTSTPHELRVGGEEYEGIFWNGVFNVEEVRWGNERIGFNLKFTSDAPFGYKDRVSLSGQLTNSGYILIGDTSDEEGYLYPDITITIQEAGDLLITNEYDERTTIVKDCREGETLSFSHLLQLKSSDGSHMIGKCFNFKFPRINNSYTNTDNKFKINLACTYNISYNPIAKVVFA